MELAPQQDDALRQVSRWLKNQDQQIFRLFGYAGTGKTTLARHFAKDVAGKVYFCAFTGKAAKVLKEKDCPFPTTIHKLIYVPKNKSKLKMNKLMEEVERLEKLLPDLNAANSLVKIKAEIKEEEEALKRPAFALNTESDVKQASLIVVDECSMVDKRMGQDLMSFGKPILVLGDPAQLPPVGGGGFFTECKPDFMLTEIHRQAKDNPILEMARIVREGGRLKVGNYGESKVHSSGADLSDIALKVDQMIAGRNKTRHASNRRIRELLNLQQPIPETGDRLVCLGNNHQKGLLNGAIYIARRDATNNPDDGRVYDLTASPEDNEGHVDVFSCWKGFLGGDGKEIPHWDIKEQERFDYGYCLTCHKSQGSQWDHVLVMDESAAFRSDAKRWLYTAITRAANRLDIIQR